MRTIFKIALFILIAAASAIMFYVPYMEVRQSATAKLNERQMLLAKMAAFGIENFFSEQRSHLLHFANDDNLLKVTESVKNTIKEEYRNHEYAVRAITVYGTDGIIKYSYPEPEKVNGLNISYQPHVRKILKEHKTNVSDVFDAVQGFKAVALSEPVFNDGRFEGVIAFLIDFEYIAGTYLRDIKIGDDGYAWMISRDGTELYYPVGGHIGENVRVTFGEFPALVTMTEEMKKGKSGTTTYIYDMLKGEFLEQMTKHAVYYPVHVFDNLWSIAVATPESEVHSELSNFFHKMLISVGVLLTALVFIVFTIIRDYHLTKINKELEKRVDKEMEKRKNQERVMLQQARFYSMGETLNAIAHQWRQPLNAVGLCIQEMEDSFRLGLADHEYMEKMAGASMDNLNKLSATIDNFRSFFAPSELLEKRNVCSIVHSIRNILHGQLDQMGISLEFKAGDECEDQSEDETQEKFEAVIYPDILKQVVLNCLQNSKEAINRRQSFGGIAEGHIYLNVNRVGNDMAISITDNGGGIPDDVIDKVFDPYFSTKDASIGMGLGLYVSKNIMEEHMGGTVTIENLMDGARAVIRFKAS